MLTGKELFDHFVSRLGEDFALGRAAVREVRRGLEAHPEWLDEVPEPRLGQLTTVARSTPNAAKPQKPLDVNEQEI